jgi:hypothetical protein
MTTPNTGPRNEEDSLPRKRVSPIPRELMSPKEKAEEWVRLYKVSRGHPEIRTLISCLKNDGPEVLRICLKQLGLERSEKLIDDALKRE